MLWLGGGPGSSSLFALFNENGPVIVNEELNLSKREYAWTNQLSMLYIDNPVGTGFSFTEHEAGYARNQNDVARNLYNALQQFFTLFSELRSNDFYVSGESYAGKYVPAIAHEIYKERHRANISLKGVAIGAGYCDPEIMINYGDFLHQIGLIDESQRAYFIEQQNKTIELMKSGHYEEAFKVIDALIDGEFTSPSYFTQVTGITCYLNFLWTNAPECFSYYQKYLNLGHVRKALHVGKLSFNDENKVVAKYLIDDFLRSVKPWVAELMNNYKVLMYTGQLDIIVPSTFIEKFLRSIEWKHRNEYLSAERKIWKIDSCKDEVAGYIKKFTIFIMSFFVEQDTSRHMTSPEKFTI
ncbi:putative serine carboxypeptidase CPVL-like protein [Dinothrombium tinctorium]|uniref:Carboxypeptidase n=1 Tax=Dinothrombium tinctorium TaxID=1965070 RepID=A0A3S3PWJ4_9ACAR|nr:putative serine carboxypeptidase CPVL-like protein [Dinothrombium tinctorium]